MYLISRQSILAILSTSSTAVAAARGGGLDGYLLRQDTHSSVNDNIRVDVEESQFLLSGFFDYATDDTIRLDDELDIIQGNEPPCRDKHPFSITKSYQQQQRCVQTNSDVIINGQVHSDNDYNYASLGGLGGAANDDYFTSSVQVMTGKEACLFCPNDAASGLACLGLENPDAHLQTVSPEQCLVCATGYSFWPCNLVDTCFCRTPAGEIILPDDLINEDTNEVGFSNTVIVAPSTAAPSKYPSVVVEEDEFEVIPLRFDIIGLPPDATLGDFKKELETAMSKIILNLAKDIQGLKVTKVEEKVGGLSAALSNYINNLVDSVYYTVEVVKDPKKRFAPLIIQALRDSYDQILQMIGSYSDVEFFTEGVTVDICVMQNGRYTACASGYSDHDLSSAIVASPSSSLSGTAVVGQQLSPSTSFAGQAVSEVDRTFERFDTNKDGKVSLVELKIGLEKELSGEYYEYSTISLNTVKRLMYDYDKSGDEALQRYEFVSVDTFSDRLDSYQVGLAGWAVALIVIFCLLFICCIGYAVGVVCCGVPNCFNYCFYHDEHDNEKTKSMSYLDDNTTTARSRTRDIFIDDHSRSAKTTIIPDVLLIENGSRYSTSTRGGGPVIEVIDEDTVFTVNSYSTQDTKSTRQQGSQIGRDPTMYYPGNTVGRDPTMYIPGREDAMDPHGSVDDSTYYDEVESKSTMKIKREPTMYVNGLGYYGNDYDDDQEEDDDSKQAKRDLKMCVDGMYSIDDSTVITEVHNDYSGSSSSKHRSAQAEHHSIPEDASVSIKSFKSSNEKGHHQYREPKKVKSYYK